MRVVTESVLRDIVAAVRCMSAHPFHVSVYLKPDTFEAIANDESHSPHFAIYASSPCAEADVKSAAHRIVDGIVNAFAARR